MRDKSLTLLTIIQLILLLIKLTGASDISWWIVTCPIWGVAVVGGLTIIGVLIYNLIKYKK